jgi:enoyl-CoA hydratase/carnithine racemase
VDFEQITTEQSDRILTITLNRPERLNAWTPTMCSELLAAFDHADEDDDVGAVIVTGAGRGFCAGARRSTGARVHPPTRFRATTAGNSRCACSRRRSPSSPRSTARPWASARR